MYLHATEAVITKFKDPEIVYMVETLTQASTESPQSVILRGKDLDFDMDLSDIKLVGEAAQDLDTTALSFAHFCSKSKSATTILSAEVRNSI